MTRVLLADDDADVLAALRALLDTDTDLIVVGTAEDGPAARRLVLELTPAVLILDVRMPGSGPELVRGLREHAPTLAIVCFSADRGSRTSMLAAGAHAFADKADPQIDLIEMVKDAHRSAGTKPC